MAKVGVGRRERAPMKKRKERRVKIGWMGLCRQAAEGPPGVRRFVTAGGTMSGT